MCRNVRLLRRGINEEALSSRHAPGIGDLDPRSAVAVVLHETEQDRRMSRVPAHATMRCRTTEARDVARPMDRITVIEKNRVRHRRPVVLARVPHALQPLRAEAAGWRTAIHAAGDWPRIPMGTIDDDGQALGGFFDANEDVGPGINC